MSEFADGQPWADQDHGELNEEPRNEPVDAVRKVAVGLPVRGATRTFLTDRFIRNR